MSIVNIQNKIRKLSKNKKDLFTRIFSVDSDVGRLKLPKEMQAWTKKNFGSISNVTSQKIIRIKNNITNESSLFNELRARRPMARDSGNIDEIKSSEKDPFCNTYKLTPSDVFGRVKGTQSLIASNIAKYDKWHSLVIFDEHNPLKFTKSSIKDNLDTAEKWFKKSHKQDKKAVYPFLLWQCLWKAGASIIHGHMQILLSKKPYANVESLNKASLDYYDKYESDYFTDLFKVHESVGLGIKKGTNLILSHLTPKKEKEIVIISDNFSNMSSYLFKVLKTYRDKLNVESFTVAIFLPPLTNELAWQNFPGIARIIDRGPLNQKTTDIGAMELFAGASVVASDPYFVFNKVKKDL